LQALEEASVEEIDRDRIPSLSLDEAYRVKSVKCIVIQFGFLCDHSLHCSEHVTLLLEKKQP
jgi:hypothetical protein